MNFPFPAYASAKIHVLYVEDDRIDRLAFTRYVKEMNLPYEYILASSLSEALGILRDRTFQIAILDYNLGDGYSNELFPILNEKKCPFVISTGSGDEETAARLMTQGAADYLIKDPERNYLKILPATIDKALIRHQNYGQLQLLNRAMQSVKDSVYILDDEGKFQYINNALAELSNISPDEAIGQTSQVLKQPYLEEWLGEIRSCSDEICSTEAEILMCRADGTNFLALVSETCVIENMHIRRVGVIRDVTSLKKIELELRNYQEGLENVVEERTRQLQQAIADLQQENQERLKIEESLRASRDQLQQQQEFFKLVIDSNPNMIFVKDWDGKFLLANQAIADLHSLTVQELLGKNDLDLNILPEEAARYFQENRQVIETQQNLFLPEEKVYRDGVGEQWQQWQKRPIILPNSNDLGVLGVGIDITDLKKIELSLRESQKRFESLAIVAPVGIFRTNTNGDAIYLNDRWCQIAGLTAAEADGGNWARALHPEDREKVATEWYASVQEQRPFQLECRFQNKDGVTTWVLCQSAAEHDIYGEIIGYVGTVTDISDRKQAEAELIELNTTLEARVESRTQELQEKEEQLRDLFDNATDLIQSVSPEGQILFVNRAWKETLGYSEVELENLSIFQIIHPEDLEHCQIAMRNLFAGEQCIGIETRFSTKDGRAILVEGNVNCQLKDGIPIATRGIFRDVTERNKAQKALEESQRLLQTVLNCLPSAVFWKDRQSVILGCNQVFAVAMGLTSSMEAVGKGNFDFSYAEEEAHKYTSEDREVMESGLSKIGIEETITLSNGEIRWVETNKIPLRDELGEVVGIVGTFQDISDRKQAENDLLESQRFLQLVLDTFPLFVFWKDRQSVYLGCNLNFATSAGLSLPSEIVGKTDYEMPWGESDAEKYRNDDQQVITSSNAKLNIIETQYQANGQIAWVETNKVPLRNLQGEIIGVLGTYQDVSDRKFAEEALAESEAFNRQLVEEFPIGLVGCRMDGQLVFVNSAFAKMLGRTIEETLELTYWDITPIKYAEQEAAQLESLQIEGRYSSYEKEYIHKDGHLVPVLLNGLMILQKGELIIWSSVQDISDRKQSEAKLQLANQELMRATRLKDEFLANMSHELRTPLNSILGMNEALQDEVFGSINDRQLKALQTIESSSTHLLSLINDILDVAKIESGQVTLDLAVTNIESLCKSSLTFIKQQAVTKRIQLIPKIPKNLPEIMVDERRIRQVLINLLNNAVKFTLEGGKITLEVSLVQSDASATHLTNPQHLRIAVIDTGIGISAENIQKLFQPFIQIDSALNRQYTGTGLGLALARRLVEIHGGSIELTSEVGVGSCFVINLPINIDSPDIEVQTEYDLSGQSQIAQSQIERVISPLILLAEDNNSNIMTFASYLQAKDYRLLFANDGLQAIAIAKAEHPDLILMDIQMPVMDGLEAIKQIRLDPDLVDVPIIALTALAMEGDRERCLEAGANDYIAKPVRLKNLDRMIQILLDK